MAKKTLYLVRHAKSSWKEAGLIDRQRPLNKRGHRNAADMARFLAGHENVPEHFITSPAKRAFTTAQYFANECCYPSFDIQVEERLYFCGITGWLSVIKMLPDTVNSVILFGHNPDISQLLVQLCERDIEALPTCSIAKLSLHTNHWSSFKEGACSLDYLLSPKDDLNKVLGKAS